MMALFYSDGKEMMLGDRVLIKRFLLRNIEGTVDYLSGTSKPNPELEIPGLATFSVSSDKTVYSWNREPNGQLEKGITLIERGKPDAPIDPDEILE